MEMCKKNGNLFEKNHVLSTSKMTISIYIYIYIYIYTCITV